MQCKQNLSFDLQFSAVSELQRRLYTQFSKAETARLAGLSSYVSGAGWCLWWCRFGTAQCD